MANDRGHGLGGFVAGFLLALVVVLGGGWLYIRYGHLPVATADPAFPMEAQIVHVPLNARIDREKQQPPFPVSEDALEAGAKVYRAQCAGCHGIPGEDVAFAKWMYPTAPQLWKKHAKGNVVGVSDDDVSETYWKVKNGIRLTGMPSYSHVLSDAEMWDVSWLVKSADQPLTDPVKNALSAPGTTLPQK